MAKDFGRTDYWAPESDLDGEEPGAYYPIPDSAGSYRKIRVNDFVDIPEGLPEDPLWGSSFQVVELQQKEVVIRFYNSATDLYEPIAVSYELIENNYQRSPDVVEGDLPVDAVVMGAT